MEPYSAIVKLRLAALSCLVLAATFVDGGHWLWAGAFAWMGVSLGTAPMIGQWLKLARQEEYSTRCEMCGGTIFVVDWNDPDVTGGILWSHEDAGCDDPYPTSPWRL